MREIFLIAAESPTCLELVACGRTVEHKANDLVYKCCKSEQVFLHVDVI